MSTSAAPASSASAASGALIPITVARGDGIGPEIMDATLRILEAADAGLEINEIEIGEQVYLSGESSGIKASAWDTLRKTGVFLKAPITTPSGGGYKSLNVTTRKTLGLYANIRPCVSYMPFIESKFPGMNVVIVRENEEDTYAGIEHQQTNEVSQCLKLISRPGCEKICRYAFEYAKAHGRKRVTCMVKDNIMKITDGMFRSAFLEVAKEYAEIETDVMIIDIGSARLADRPETFDVIVTLNLYGDVISDIAAEIAGSVGLAGTANLGETCAMFEAIHGSAPDIAGKDMANPSGLLLAAVQLLVHVGRNEAAEKVHNAWYKTIEDGIHTGDIYTEGQSTKKVGTRAFGDAVIERLGQKPTKFEPASYANKPRLEMPKIKPYPARKKGLVGVDVFMDWDENDRDANVLAKKLEQAAEGTPLMIRLITNRGVKVWPEGMPETFCTDHWRCRFKPREEGGQITHGDVVKLLSNLDAMKLDFIKTEHLCTFDGKISYSLGQGE
ncbi:MAG: NADP-dependent isocitrate dehydrogenase [Phycisphaerales bacterium]